MRFRDLKSGIMHEAGEVFETSPERLAEFKGSKYGVLAEEFGQEEPEERTEESDGEYQSEDDLEYEDGTEEQDEPANESEAKRQVRRPRQKVR